MAEPRRSARAIFIDELLRFSYNSISKVFTDDLARVSRKLLVLRFIDIQTHRDMTMKGIPTGQKALRLTSECQVYITLHYEPDNETKLNKMLEVIELAEPSGEIVAEKIREVSIWLHCCPPTSLH